MTVPQDHRQFLARKGLALGCSNIFPEEELEALQLCGAWLQALDVGAIRPFTDQQRHFVQVAKGKAEPATLYERAWCRLKARQAFEAMEKMGTKQTLVVPLAAEYIYGVPFFEEGDPLPGW